MQSAMCSFLLSENHKQELIREYQIAQGIFALKSSKRYSSLYEKNRIYFPFLSDKEVERYTFADLELRKLDRDMNRIVPEFGGITLREVKRISSKLLQLNNQRKQKI